MSIVNYKLSPVGLRSAGAQPYGAWDLKGMSFDNFKRDGQCTRSQL